MCINVLYSTVAHCPLVVHHCVGGLIQEVSEMVYLCLPGLDHKGSKYSHPMLSGEPCSMVHMSISLASSTRNPRWPPQNRRLWDINECQRPSLQVLCPFGAKTWPVKTGYAAFGNNGTYDGQMDV